ncbi:SDR family NAD(P)-dependent oxidoreductase [Ruminiclostridium josui]|uniref:SDR family NAD(P)-dependent oxidoreductase n=1 Tax=Ruminiclostridium josui TaxID=1499 RepID=UPI0006D01441|nr:SDR family oxidoreductase [Ruminiclostridium josui]
MDRLNGKVAVVIGATSGIGKATAALFAKEGAKVIFTGRREEVGKKVEKEIIAQGGQVEFFKCDATVEEECKALVDYVVEKYGRIDVLHNNAGILIDADFLGIDLVKNFDRTINTNLRSQISVMQLVLPVMLKQKSGSVINTASVGGIITMPNNIPYSVSKAAIIHMTRTLAKTYAKEGIRFNSVCPGLTYSEMVEPGNDFDKAVLPGVPMGRGAQPEEIANGVLFLASMNLHISLVKH